MEVVAVHPFGTSPNPSAFSPQSAKHAADSLILAASLPGASKADDKDTGISDVFKALTVTAQEVVEKLNELLKGDLPDGLEGLNPDEVTPEATAERIVTGATSYFEVFARQNPTLTGEELLNRFLSTIRGGIDKGYTQAVGILEGLGAFEFDGVKSGVQKTKGLIDQKLAAFEAFKREELGLSPSGADEVAASLTKNSVGAQAGAAIARSGGLNVTA